MYRIAFIYFFSTNNIYINYDYNSYNIYQYYAGKSNTDYSTKYLSEWFCVK